jgi:hypothetical protein
MREIVNISVDHSASVFKVHAYSSKVKLETILFPKIILYLL